MGNYESFRFEATVEVDNKEFTDYTFENLITEADHMLSLALAKELHEAAEVTLTQNSFVLTMEL